ncbi:bifunctional demethylmenaquinone methyltransferase/2-methoxy-6-polyprenyl-1,4-benzoquinol methylase UbiE [Chloroflexota bacterium]
MQTRRSEPLHRMFTAVPRRYDLVNHVITLGIDKRWRWKAARKCLTTHPRKVLDLCCGTGDLALNLAQLADNNTELTGIDYSQPMLKIAAKKAASSGRGDISFIHGDVASLPFPDGYFDCVGISFAFRNLTYKNPLTRRYLAEVLRVLTAGGRFVIVETSQPKSKLIRKLFHLYMRWFVSRVGHWLSGNKGAYHYLAESAAHFFTAEEAEAMLLAAGFHQVSFRPLLFGAVGIYVAVK